MKKNPPSQAGIFNPRALLGFALCFIGISLAVVTFAAPRATSRARGKGVPVPSALRPTVINSALNGVSSSVRDLPVAGPTERTYEEFELPPVKPAREIPADFVDQAVQHALNRPEPPALPTPKATFEGLNQGEACGGCIPPDTTGAVGPSQYVQMTNSSFSVYSKDGTRLSGPTPINRLFQSFPVGNVCRATNNGDPIVVYDQLADRWLLSQFGFANVNTGPWHECIAVSQSGDATGAYYIYDFTLSTTKFHDYPHIGLWPDGYYMATHEFTPSGTSFTYGGAAAIAFEREKMLNGQAAQQVLFDLGNLPEPYHSGYGGHLPSNLDGFTLPPAGAPNYFVEIDGAGEIGAGSVASMRIWKFHVDWATPANSTFGIASQPNSILPVTDFARPPCSLAGNRAYVAGCVPQLGDPSQLDPIGDRLMYRLAYRNFGDHEALVLNHTVVVSAIQGQPVQMGPRWYEVRDPGGTPTIFQQSTFGATGPTDVTSRFMGSIALDRAGDIAIGYSASSAVQFPAINYAGRLVGDTLNTLAQGEGILYPGNGAQHGEAFAPQTGRWGDYSTITVDPYDDCTFWYTNEYYNDPAQPTANWHTRIGNFKYTQCTPRPIGFLTGFVTDASSNPIVGAKVTAGGYTAFTTKGGVYQFSPLTPGNYTAAASATGYFPSSTSVAITDGNTTRQDFTLTRNLAEPTPTPPPLPNPLQNVNPPTLNDPGTTINNNHYSVTWSPAEVTTGLAGYQLEESTDYTVTLFDNADSVPPVMPGDATSPWTKGSTTAPWIQDPAYRHSVPNSYYAVGDAGAAAVNTAMTLKNNITIPGTVGSARLNFWSRFYNDGDDTGNVEASTDGGNTWTTLRTLLDAPMVPPADTRMQDQELDLTAYKGVPMKLRYRFSSGTLIYFLIRTLGWWVDDILVDGATWTQVASATANTTSTQIINKPSGHYYYRVRGVYGDGSVTAFSNVQDIIVNAPTPPTLNSVESVKAHAGTDYGIPLPLTNPPGIECRSGGPNGVHKLVFTFAAPVTVNGTPKAQVTSGTGSVSNVTVNGNKVSVDLTGVANAQDLTVTLFSVSDQTNTADVSVKMGVLLGDVNHTRLVDGNDVSAVQANTRQTLDVNNFIYDVNTTGLIDGNDVSTTQGQTRAFLP
ncbi:MAG: carboxypeptidase regulatory-like domain-containing protein [Verrucomicrobiota bacterium]|nr:carboxypeptidase regulatory-like domain-containing protein [Verrucomicrobiota bacterium]MDQ6938550.1 carboxypeptidase regulatory-like domain-containing protein [Verrucomicrobiota bacterium]